MSKTTTKSKLKCDHCNKSFMLKNNLIKHLSEHTNEVDVMKFDKSIENKCTKCDIVFTNKGLLMCHTVKHHTDKSSPQIVPQNLKHYCNICEQNFHNPKDHKFHIRETHFNLKHRTPYCDSKKVNQVWFEKVLNTNSIVEMKKVSENVLLIKKLDDNTAMKVSEHPTEVIDLHSIYPTTTNIQCHICLKIYDKWYINKHIADVHKKHQDMEVMDK